MTPIGAEKYSASMDAQLLEQVRADAKADGVSLSSWLAEAAAERLRLHSLWTLIDQWEAEHGSITADEMHAFQEKVSAATHQASTSHAPADLMAAIEASLIAARPDKAKGRPAS
jgi:hypothetical protein